MSSTVRAGRQLPRYEITGPLDGPVVVALGGISATRHVCSSGANTGPGWWERTVGPSRAIDTTRFRILGVDWADGGCDTDGRPLRTVSTYHQANLLAAALDDAGIACVHAVVGASYGGMVALAFAERFPARVERLVVIGAAHRAHPMTTAYRTIQRRIVELGLETGRASDALAIARGLGVATYRSAAEFSERWPSRRALEDVDAYLRVHGARFARRFPPERFLSLSHSADVHEVDPANITTPTVLVAIEDDAVVPREQMVELASRLSGPVRVVDLPSPKGHDGFLTEHDALAPILIGALLSDIDS